MQNIVEVMTNGDRMAIVLRDVTSGTYSAHAYKRIPNGEFERLPGVLHRSFSKTVAEFAADKYVANR